MSVAATVTNVAKKIGSISSFFSKQTVHGEDDSDVPLASSMSQQVIPVGCKRSRGATVALSTKV